jgi:hypothetical protein
MIFGVLLTTSTEVQFDGAHGVAFAGTDPWGFVILGITNSPCRLND